MSLLKFSRWIRRSAASPTCLFVLSNWWQIHKQKKKKGIWPYVGGKIMMQTICISHKSVQICRTEFLSSTCTHNTLSASAATCCSAQQWVKQAGRQAGSSGWSVPLRTSLQTHSDRRSACWWGRHFMHAGWRSGFFGAVSRSRRAMQDSIHQFPITLILRSWSQGVLERLPAVLGWRRDYTHKLPVCHRAAKRDEP